MNAQVLTNKLQWFQEYRQTMLSDHDHELSNIDQEDVGLYETVTASHAQETIAILHEELLCLYEYVFTEI